MRASRRHEDGFGSRRGIEAQLGKRGSCRKSQHPGGKTPTRHRPPLADQGRDDQQAAENDSDKSQYGFRNHGLDGVPRAGRCHRAVSVIRMQKQQKMTGRLFESPNQMDGQRRSRNIKSPTTTRKWRPSRAAHLVAFLNWMGRYLGSGKTVEDSALPTLKPC